ncbi:MAG: LysE family transporter [Acidobacteria bacterium]|nr:LysE family transporter [Acidobacteriota bacterium]
MNLKELFTAFGLGIAFAAPPGIVTAECIRRGLAGGFWSAMAVGVGSLIGDAVYAVLTLSGLAILTQRPAAQLAIGIVGSVVLFVLARDALKAKLPETSESLASGERRNAFLSGAVLSLTNPWAIAFWIGFGGVLLSAGIRDPASEMGLFLAAFLTGAAIWGVILSVLIALGRRFVNPTLFRGASIASATIFVGTGLYTGWQVIRNLWS